MADLNAQLDDSIRSMALHLSTVGRISDAPTVVEIDSRFVAQANTLARMIGGPAPITWDDVRAAQRIESALDKARRSVDRND